ncbi:MAG: hypothetical protein MUQ65_03840 [Armatimonadetes bacterium]|nr:hypothetical protein [Armatimonadota bacterium]
MQRFAWLSIMLVVTAGILLAAGCGRPTLPGKQFQGERRVVPGTGADTPLPEQPILVGGSDDAEVRVTAFFPIDEPHQRLRDLLESIAEEYQDKVYIRYADYRTPEGAQLFAQAELQVSAILINHESSVELESPTGPRTVDFVKDMGRYWTGDDLREAVAQAVAEAYGGGSVPRG